MIRDYILTRGRLRAYLDCCMLLLHHTHNRQRGEDEDGATCIMKQYEKDDELPAAGADAEAEAT